ncbi:hypothetical protein [Fluviispira sanaruensis]|uniref:Uncharacterized protein n=1 Tax=Fluviispira sanaruensis TaxID=2493639 RepID=A0A4P2VJZ8_FLUSA|nr:hypothetical protein [Fluviispira sanaruensis]BBH53536.1 hypothetical protein JCM31447_19800 [Fluviispira sanaruensis]
MVSIRQKLFPKLMIISSIFYSVQISADVISPIESLAPKLANARKNFQTTSDLKSEKKENRNKLLRLSNLAYLISTQKLNAHLGDKSEAIVTITNTSPSDYIRVEPLPLTYPLQILNNSCDKELSPSQSCVYKIIFSPQRHDQKGSDEIKIAYYNGNDSKLIKLDQIKFQTIPKNVLDLSMYDEVYASLNMGTICSEKRMYANGKHNIPLFPSLSITDKNYKKITVDEKEVYDAIQVFVRRGNTNLFIEQENNSSTYSVSQMKNKFSRCMNSPTNDSYNYHKLFFTSSNGGENIIIGGKIEYINKLGEIKTIQTSDNGYLTIQSLDKIIYPTENLFHLVQEKSTGFGFTASTRSVVRVSPKVEVYPNLYHYRLSSFSMTDTTFGEHYTTGLKPLKFNRESFNLVRGFYDNSPSMKYNSNQNYDVGINYNFKYGRKFQVLDLISLKHKPNLIDSINLDGSYFSLASFQKNDLALVTQSYCNGCTHVSADVYFKLTLDGHDTYGNDFKFISDSRQNNLYL